VLVELTVLEVLPVVYVLDEDVLRELVVAVDMLLLLLVAETLVQVDVLELGLRVDDVVVMVLGDVELELRELCVDELLLVLVELVVVVLMVELVMVDELVAV